MLLQLQKKFCIGSKYIFKCITDYFQVLNIILFISIKDGGIFYIHNSNENISLEACSFEECYSWNVIKIDKMCKFIYFIFFKLIVSKGNGGIAFVSGQNLFFSAKYCIFNFNTAEEVSLFSNWNKFHVSTIVGWRSFIFF